MADIDLIAIAESKICGACIENEKWANRAIWILKPEDFGQMDYRLIFTAICDLIQAGKPVDTVQIGARVPASAHQKLISLPIDILNDRHFESTLSTVKEASKKRRLGNLADKVKRGAGNGETSDNIIQSLINSANEIVNDVERSEEGTIDEAVIAHDAFIEKIQAGDITPVKLPFYGLEEVVLYPGNQCIIGAHTSVGKTAFALHTAIESARIGHRVLFISTEMSVVEMIQRVASDRCGTGIGLMRQRNIKLDNHPELRRFQDEIKATGGELKIRYIPGCSEVDIRAEFDAMESGGGTDILFVDYIQNLECRARINKSLREQIGFLSRWLMKEADNRQCVNFVLSQLSRPGKEDRYANKKPTVWDLRESGNLECDPAVVILLHREDRSADYRNWNITATVAKNRNGSLCEYTYTFDSWSAQWK